MSNIVPTGKFTLAEKVSKSVVMESGSDKRYNINVPFTIRFSNEFLPIQLIYGGKNFKFAEKFSLCANPTNYYNSTEYQVDLMK